MGVIINEKELVITLVHRTFHFRWPRNVDKHPKYETENKFSAEHTICQRF